MTKLFDKDGNEVEAYTPEELEAKNQEAVDNYIKENPSKKDELEKLESDLKIANEKITEFEKGGEGDEGGDEQKKRLKQAKIDAENALENGLKEVKDEMTKFKEGFVSGHKTKVLEKLSGGDPELLKKIEFEYDQYSEGKAVPVNETEIQERLTKAFTLATGAAPAHNFMDGMSNSTARGEGQNGGTGDTTEQETDNSKNMRKAFGITDKEAEEFAPSSN